MLLLETLVIGAHALNEELLLALGGPARFGGRVGEEDVDEGYGRASRLGLAFKGWERRWVDEDSLAETRLISAMVMCSHCQLCSIPSLMW